MKSKNLTFHGDKFGLINALENLVAKIAVFVLPLGVLKSQI